MQRSGSNQRRRLRNRKPNLTPRRFGGNDNLHGGALTARSKNLIPVSHFETPII